MFARACWLGVALFFVGCTPLGKGVAVKVNLISDYAAGAEAALATVDIVEGDADSVGRVVRHFERPLAIGDALSTGLQVAQFEGIAKGTYTLRGELFRRDGTLLGGRPLVVVVVDGDNTFTIDVTAACANVTCGTSTSAGASTVCFGGACVDPRCGVSALQYCAGASLCLTDSDCGVSSSTCSARHCESGICVARALPAMCANTEYCARESGCVSLTGPTTEPPSTVSICDTVCRVSACDYGYYKCTDGMNPVCTSLSHRPAGAPCGTGNICDGEGTCTSMLDGGTDAGDAGSDASMGTTCAMMNGGCAQFCSESTAGVVCGCGAGYVLSSDGHSCNDVNECLVMNGGCDTNATCMNTVGAFMCSCNSGFTGDGSACTDINECLSMNGGCDQMTSCTNIAGGRLCGACPSGFTGTGDTGCVDINECAVNNGGCSTGVLCTNTIGSFMCGSCPAGYTGSGSACTDINECRLGTDNCDPLALCTNTPGSFTCGACPSGYTGDGTVCVDVNECQSHTDNCASNATCANTAGSFTCACNAGFTGSGTTCTDVNECTAHTSNCATHATCTNTSGSFTCACNTGYVGSGVTCADVNECTNGTATCDTNAACTNTAGSYACACHAGFTGDGHTCTDVNECLTMNGGCDSHTSCTNIPGSRVCSACPSGFTGTGDTSCVDINECAVNNGGCAMGVTCVNTPGSFTCGSCPSGYTGNGMTCTDINECTAHTSNCSPLVTCTNTPGSFTCGACPSGYMGDGTVCTDVNECSTSNGGCAQTCTNTAGSFTCSCGAGYTLNANGHSCDDVNECLSANGGCAQVCTNIAGSFHCGCNAGYTLNVNSTSCDDVNECLTSNGGCAQTCANTAGSFTCSCGAGYTLNANAHSCDDVNECLASNGGCAQTCSNSTGSFSCSCTSGYTLNANGHACDDINECATANGGCDAVTTCTNSVGSFSCGACPSGYSGTATTVCYDVNECLASACPVGDSCVNYLGSYQCGMCSSAQVGTGIPSRAGVMCSSGLQSVGAVGAFFSCALLGNGTVGCWGTGSPDGVSTATPHVVAGLTNVTQVGVGLDFACALTNIGAVYCWGNDASGQLGNDPAFAAQTTPQMVSGFNGLASDSSATALAVGYGHACATMKYNGSVRCWGNNASGQLGNASQTNSPTPVLANAHASPAIAATALTAGYAHTCALTSLSTVVCWGDRSEGQLGDGNISATPITSIESSTVQAVHMIGGVSTLGHVALIAAGYRHTCAVDVNGQLYCWGNNNYGELGTNDMTTYALAVGVEIGNIVGVASGPVANSTGVIDGSGTLYCFGDDTSGACGLGGLTAHVLVPTAVPNIGPVSSMGYGTGAGCALGTDGTVKCWGQSNHEEDANGNETSSSNINLTPATTAAMPDANAISMGTNFGCAVRQGGAVWCFGRNNQYQLGNGTTTTFAAPTPVGGAAFVATTVSAGTSSACAVTNAHGVKCWGANNMGQVGSGSAAATIATPASVNFSSITPAPALANVSVGGTHACAVSTTGTLYCWGSNAAGQLGNATVAMSTNVPVAVSGLTAPVTQSCAGLTHSCAALTNGTVACWGGNTAGQVGNGVYSTSVATPTVVSGLTRVTQVSCGALHTCARKSNGVVWCWGNNADGELGVAGAGTHNTPVQPILPSGAWMVSAGQLSTCVVTTAGGVVCFGDNRYGELGQGTVNLVAGGALPIAVPGLSGIVGIGVSGNGSACAQQASGTIYCWGADASYLGIGSQASVANTATPTAIWNGWR